MNARNTKAATVKLEAEAAEKLITTGRLRIGVVKCIIFRRLSVLNGRKCFSYEHVAKECDQVEQMEERRFIYVFLCNAKDTKPGSVKVRGYIVQPVR